MIKLVRFDGLSRSTRNKGWAGPLNYWPEKNRAKFDSTRYDLARYGPARLIFFFALKRLFGPTDPIFRTDWVVKILA